jgi:prepilin-type N-terminal cleavage/methylation domain-containing protein
VSAAVNATPPTLGGEDGFTLVEMLTAMTVFSILIAVFATTFGSAIRHSDEIEEQSNLQVETRAAITFLSQDLRQVYDGDANVLTSPIESIGPTQITFLTPDRATPFHMRRLSYRLTGGQFERAMATSSDTDGYPWSIPALGSYRKLVGSVANATAFTYKDAAGLTTAVPANVRTVHVTLTVATNTTPARQYTYQTNVSLRSES